MVWFVFGQTLTFDFVNYDDNEYITENALVLGGISKESLVQALKSDYSFYHPFTTISHMIDYEIYGLNPAGFHFTNVVLHTMSAVILFLVLRAMTGSLWKSFMVAAVFAIHPLRAESVAWVTERKDCLSGFFFMLTLAAYVRYVRVREESSPQKAQKTQNESGELSADCAEGRRGENSPQNTQKTQKGISCFFLKPQATSLKPLPPCFFLKPKASCLTPSYLLVFLCMAACMLSKATVVTLPFVLILLDYWPLRRFGRRDLSADFADERRLEERELATKERREHKEEVPPRNTQKTRKGIFGFSLKPFSSGFKFHLSSFHLLLLEKLPFFLLSAVMAAVMVLSSGESMHSFGHSSFLMRLSNAVISYVTYIGQLFVPINLALLYPYPLEAIPFWKSGGSILLLGGITFFIARTVCKSSESLSPKSEIGNQKSAMLLGWLWFLGMLVPMIGIVQAGAQAHADRYTYLSGIGLSVALCWGVDDWFRRRSVRKVFVGGLLGVILLTLSWCGGQQVSYWKTSVALWGKAIQSVENNYLALNNMGMVLVDLGDAEEGIKFYQEALVCNPNYYGIHNNLGIVYKKQGRFELSMASYERALSLNPSSVESMNNIATVHGVLEKNEEAEEMYRSALELEPANSMIHKNFGIFLAGQGRNEEAILELSEALVLNSFIPSAYTEMTSLLVKQGRMKDAFLCAKKAIEVYPKNPILHFNLGVLFEGVGEKKDAILCYERALQISPEHSQAKDRLASLIDQGRKGRTRELH